MSNADPILFPGTFPADYYRRCSEALNTALDRVAMYQSWRRFDPGRDHNVDERFAAMPVLGKRDIREHFSDGILPLDQDMSRGLADGEIELVQTSGTTDDKITNLWNQRWWDASERASWKLNANMARVATGDHPEAILVNPRNVGVISDAADLPMEKRRLARFLYLNEKTDTVSWSTEHMERMVEELNAYRPAVLEANPSMLARLCRYIAAADKKVFQPDVIVFTYEYPTVFHHRQIRTVFDVPMASSYGTTETGYVFMQCERGRLHQNIDFCRVDFQPFKRECGGPWLGRIVVTPLGNPWNYLVRFDTGDIVCLEDSGSCPCGRKSGLILASVNGRVTNITLTNAGRPVALGELDAVVGGLADVEEYKVVQSDAVTYEMHLVSSREDKAGLTREATKVLRNLYGDRARVSVIFETAIAPEGSGKYQLAKTLFPVDVEQYLDARYFAAREAGRRDDQ
jgi:phenylacetate-coenzyme A ligase PaaK-like adenylate-forming protein